MAECRSFSDSLDITKQSMAKSWGLEVLLPRLDKAGGVSFFSLYSPDLTKRTLAVSWFFFSYDLKKWNVLESWFFSLLELTK